MSAAVRRVWVLACPSAEILDVAGPWSVFGHTNAILGSTAYQTELVTPLGTTVPTSHGLALAGASPLSFRRKLPDIAVVAGGFPTRPLAPADAHLVRWLRKYGERLPLLASVCTAAFVLAEAGLLDGRRAMTHWAFTRKLAQLFPKARVQNNGVFAIDGHIWTSAGVSAGIDMTLAMVESHHGHAVAMAVAKQLVLFLRRSGDQAQFSHTLRHQEQEPPRLRGLSAFILAHLHEDLRVDRLASKVGMSPRSLSRWCQRQWGCSPAELVRRQRVSEAQRLLCGTPTAIEEIAQRTGLGDVRTMRRAFQQTLGVSPSTYRDRFTSVALAGPHDAD
ncbi:MAG: helix-turn-helix domain-containing protein [Nannocystaceae bacterium]|nr:helix-turn-helix domain-containing protein [Nannocystaceae bacterium]